MEKQYDVVKNPKHYNREGAMECIDEMVVIFGLEDTLAFCKLNAWKYRYRAADKNGEEDLKKSDWYINKYAELSQGIKPKEESLKSRIINLRSTSVPPNYIE